MIQSFSQLSNELQAEGRINSCFTDTSTLFSASYPLDLFNEDCERLFERLHSQKITIFSNVTVRAEFLENHRRVLIAESLIDFLEDFESKIDGPLVEKLKSHRTSYRRKISEEKSRRVDPSQIRLFRRLMSNYPIHQATGWEVFCRHYLDGKLEEIWAITRDQFQVEFISLYSESDKSQMNERPQWEKTLSLMGRYGMASSDAMIVNMFLCSKIPALLTADKEMAECVEKESQGSRAIFMPDSAMRVSDLGF